MLCSKRLHLRVLLLLSAIIALFTLSTWASDELDVPTAEIVFSEQCNDNVTAELTEDGILTISGTGAMSDFTAYPWKDYQTRIKSVVISEGITSIERFAFYGCTSLTDVTIPGSVTSIGAWAFYGCSSLDSVAIPNSVTSVGSNAFDACKSLVRTTYEGSVCELQGIDGYLNLKSSISTLDSHHNFICTVNEANQKLEYNCNDCSAHYSLSYVVDETDAAITKIQDVAVAAGLDVNIPANITGHSVVSIGAYAFSCCSSLVSVTMPDSVISIGNTAFQYCSSLVTVGFPNNDTTLGSFAFQGCQSLTAVDFSGMVATIGPYAFLDCGALTTVSIPQGVAFIGTSAFQNCKSLATVSIPNGITSLGGSAFENCTSLADITITGGLTSIADSAFQGCSALTSVTIPDSVDTIGQWAFAGCLSLTSVAMPASVSFIGYKAFIDCSSLDGLTIPVSVSDIGGYAFGMYYSEVYKKYRPINNFTADVYPGTTGEEYCKTNGVNYTLKFSFSDVPGNVYFTVPVAWAASIGITAGTSATSFSPEQTCTRAQMVTFLYRMAGKPAVSGSNPFKDVKQDDYYYNAVLWGYQNGIVYGTNKDHFSPDDMVTRAQCITFLYRYANKPYGGWAPFVDVKSRDYYSNAVCWGYTNRIVYGTDSEHFSPDENCTRAQVVTFLYRYAVNYKNGKWQR